MAELAAGSAGRGAWLLSQLQNVSSEMVEFVQRVAILVSDLVFILAAFFLKWDPTCEECRCSEPLRLYVIGCVVICVFDSLLELTRCMLEGSLDQLQAECSNVSSSPVSDQGLLGGDTLTAGEASAAAAARTIRRTMLSLPHASPFSYVAREKSSKQKRTMDLQRWSFGLTVVVALLYSFFSAHDEDCAREMPQLNSYISCFAYTFILRLGVIILGICCRTVKDYEDAANGGSLAPEQGVPMNNI